MSSPQRDAAADTAAADTIDAYVPRCSAASFTTSSPVAGINSAFDDVFLRLSDDELIASGPDEGHPMLAARCGWHLTEDDDTGEHTLEPLARSGTSAR